jgi:hypothetical protein
MLSYLRGSVGCLLGGIGLIKFLDHPVYLLVGSALFLISAFLFVAGILRFRSTRNLMSEIDPADWHVVEERIGKTRPRVTSDGADDLKG